MYFCDIENRKSKELAPGVWAKTFWGDKILLSLVEFDPDSEVSSHSHPHEQAGIVLAGELEMRIGEKTKMLQPRDSYIIPGNVEHSARTGNGTARILDVFSPMREEYQY